MAGMGLSTQRKVTLAILMVGTFLAVLNQTLLSPALAAIMRDLQIDAPTVQYVMSAFSLVQAVVIPLSPYFMGRFSTRQLYIGGLSLFATGCILCAFAPSFPFLLLGRSLQAFAAGMFMPMIFTVVLLIFPREHRGAGMGLVGLVIGFAPALGPTLSGVLVDSIGWRALFFVTLAVALVMIVAAAAKLESYGDFESVTFDKPSVMLSSIGLACLLYGLSSFSSSPNVVVPAALIVVGAMVVGLFVRRQLHLERPLLQVRVLKTRNYRLAATLAMMNFGAIIGMGTLLPLYLQSVRGFSALETGLTMLPGALLGAFTGMLAGRLFDRLGVRRCVVPGVSVYLLGALGLGFFDMDMSLYAIAGIYALLIVGNQFMTTPMNTWGINSLDNRVIQHANALTNTLNQVSASFMTALIVSVSALGWAIDPEGTPASQAFAGDHLAFLVVTCVVCVAFAIVVTCVRDRAAEPSRTASYVMECLPVDGDPDAITVGQVMEREPGFVRQTDTIRAVGQAMVARKTGGLPVVNGARSVVGFISDGDIMKYIGSSDDILDQSYMVFSIPDVETFPQRVCDLIDLNVMRIATRDVVSVTPQTTLEDACRLLSERRIKKVPVIEDGKLVGTLSRSDIIRSTMANLVAIRVLANGQGHASGREAPQGQTSRR